MAEPLREPPVLEQPVQPAATPIIYVTEPIRWEYKQLVRDLTREGLLDEEGLNRLGDEGWELAAAFTQGNQAWYVFKRVRG